MCHSQVRFDSTCQGNSIQNPNFPSIKQFKDVPLYAAQMLLREAILINLCMRFSRYLGMDTDEHKEQIHSTRNSTFQWILNLHLCQKYADKQHLCLSKKQVKRGHIQNLHQNFPVVSLQKLLEVVLVQVVAKIWEGTML